jgi:hypothetical protein
MRFLVTRSSQGAVSKRPPCVEAIRGTESPAWSGQYQWFVEMNTLDDLVAILNRTGGALGLFAPDEGEAHPVLEIYDDTDEGE